MRACDVLVLVDFIFSGEPEVVQVKHCWNKVLVIHPRNYSLEYEVQKLV